MVDFKRCDRCGKVKPPPRYNTSCLCLECESETLCKHYINRPPGMMPRDWICGAGVDVTQLTLPLEGCMTRLPCRFLKGNKPVKCDKFEPVGIEYCKEVDQDWFESNRKMRVALKLMAEIKMKHKGTDWAGVIDCPTGCGGKLSLSHAAYNGRVHGHCSSPNCLSWME